MDNDLRENVILPRQRGDYPPQIQHVRYSIRLLTPDVVNQKKEPYCQLYTYADMLGTVFTVWLYKKIKISPQVMIDFGIRDVYHARAFLVNRGLEKERSYPAHRVVDPDQNPEEYLMLVPDDENQPKVERHPKTYTLKSIKQYSDQYVIRVLLSNNFVRGGNRFPAVAIMRMGAFGNFERAKLEAEPGRFFTEERPPNLTPEKAEHDYGVLHSLLIVGINTMSPLTARHYVEVKNTWGRKWGNNGFSKVAIDLLEYVYYPTVNVKHYPLRIPRLE